LADSLIEGGVHPRPRSLSAGRWLTVRLAAVALTIGLATPVDAHDGGPGIVVQPAIVAPGDVINVRGDNLWTDADVQVTLLGPDGERIPLGDGMTDGEAHLDLLVTLPADLTAGGYQVEVTNALAERVTASLLVESESSEYLIGLLAAAVTGLVLVIVTARMFGTRRRSASGRN
jgi:hypothetical protein